MPAVTLELPLGVGKMTINLEKTIAGFAELGINASKMAVDAWGGARTRNAPDIRVLSQYLPVFKPLVGLGDPKKYEVYEFDSEGRLRVTSPSTTFEFWTKTMPIFNAIAFCGQAIGAGDINVGRNIREGFVFGLLPTGPIGISKQKAIHYFKEIVSEIWEKGGGQQPDPQWLKWKSKFSVAGQCKASVIRDLIRLTREKRQVSLQVSDLHAAAVAFGLAQVNLCKIVSLNFGSGLMIYTPEESGFEGIKLEASERESDYIAYYYFERALFFRFCGVPEELLEKLMIWLDNEIASTILLGIEHGDPPGTVIMTPGFCALSQSGAIKSLGSLVKNIGLHIAEKCEACGGSCVKFIHKVSSHSTVGCRTVFFLNMLITIYVSGVLQKAGMHADQCMLSGDLERVIKSLKELKWHGTLGLSSFLTSWYILRSGKSAPHVDEGIVLGLEIDGKIHGLRHAVKPGTKGLPLVSFDGHIRDGSHTFACLVFQSAPQLLHSLDRGCFTIVTERPPDVIPKPVLNAYSEPDYIAVFTSLLYPGNEQLHVDLGAYGNYRNIHRCNEETEELAIPLQVSECVNGCSTVKLDHTHRYTVYTYNNENLQSWIYGAFPAGMAWFQGCRPLHSALALMKPGEVLIQGSSNKLHIEHK
ncbi:uncharacterized protein B0P05DRAFT_206833 [Gilbertella persicaria]|uniref:uncharacterized protein n=1 Tax=Gilbertella persicaria TaxID=101096 RepID=UPI00221E3F0B|nr:uncharacterized protein B0P05DRAFT_206833 [Gilbertella persicaria]KAI8066993.1 hypothetical protein B0P05DRAFT_206833 [Gilbertella persicaria]